MKNLTKRQQELFDYLREEIISGRPMPSVREVASHFGLRSTRTIRDHLAALERKGMIKREARKARAIRVITNKEQTEANISIPIIGSIPAGLPEDQTQNVDKLIHVDPASLGVKTEDKLFALRVHGDSMIQRGIYDGDIAIVESSKNPRTGDVVAALIDNEVTLKTFIKTDKETFLRPENQLYKDIVPVNELMIQGVARIIIRTL
jgi:repressor LexA